MEFMKLSMSSDIVFFTSNL